MMNFTVIIQARMGSTRLPGKVLLPLGKHNTLGYVVDRCREISGITQVVVATSTLEQDTPIEEWCKVNKVDCFRGSEEDVLLRYYECAIKFKAEYILRVTADCPFVDYELASMMVETMIANPSDILVYEGELPRGLAVEVISFDALEKINSIGNESRHREHVTYFAYENIELFTSVSIKLPEKLNQPQFRITLDTQEDYLVCQAIADEFANDVLISSSEIIEYLLRSPEVSKLNSHILQKPVE